MEIYECRRDPGHRGEIRLWSCAGRGPLWEEGSDLSRAQAKTEGSGKGVHSGSLLEKVLR